jgi:hypothetical protein
MTAPNPATNAPRAVHAAAPGAASPLRDATDDASVSWRTYLLLILVAGVVGTMVELLLLKHFEDPWQFAPLGLGGAFLLAVLWYAFSRSATPVRVVRWLSALSCISAAVGIFFHYRANVEWELEATPDLHGFALFREAITGALPLLAPGTMLQLGLLGLVWTFRHPRFATPARRDATSLES